MGIPHLRCASRTTGVFIVSSVAGTLPASVPLRNPDAELRAAGRHRSARQLLTYAKRTRKQLIAGAQKRRAERTKPAGLSE
jgi:hypothetical protein